MFARWLVILFHVTLIATDSVIFQGINWGTAYLWSIIYFLCDFFVPFFNSIEIEVSMAFVTELCLEKISLSTLFLSRRYMSLILCSSQNQFASDSVFVCTFATLCLAAGALMACHRSWPRKNIISSLIMSLHVINLAIFPRKLSLSALKERIARTQFLYFYSSLTVLCLAAKTRTP